MTSSANADSPYHRVPTPIYTPFTLEVKVAKRGKDPYYISWHNLNVLERFLVFKTAIETKDPVLERKRPWIAKFLLNESHVDMMTYSKKYGTDFKEEALLELQRCPLPSDKDLAQMSMQLLPPLDKKRRNDQDDQYHPSSKRQRSESFSSLHSQSSFASSPSSSTLSSYQNYTQQDIKKLENRIDHLARSYTQLFAALGGMYYHLGNELRDLQNRCAGIDDVRTSILDVRRRMGFVTDDEHLEESMNHSNQHDMIDQSSFDKKTAEHPNSGIAQEPQQLTETRDSNREDTLFAQNNHANNFNIQDGLDPSTANRDSLRGFHCNHLSM